MLSQVAYALDSDVDLSFNASTNGTVTSLVVQNDGAILLAGTFNTVNGQSNNMVARLTPNGTLDPSFTNLGANFSVSAMAVQADGKILLGGGFTMIGDTPRNRLARLNIDGTLDDSFNPNVDGSGFSTSIVAIALQVIDGVEHILIGGDFTTLGTASNTTNLNNIARLDLEGNVDTNFANVNPNNDVFAIALDVNNNIFIGGLFTTVTGEERSVARLSPNGELDANFDSPQLAFLDTSSTISTLVVQEDNRLLAGGRFDRIDGSDMALNNITRFNSNGELDTDFVSLEIADPFQSVFELILLPNGQIIVAGSFANVNDIAGTANLARLNPDGSLDDSFTPNLMGSGRSLARQADGNILVGGTFTSVGGETRANIARLGAADNDLCLPIQPRNGKIAVVCL